jgi:hypothetical protein
MEGLNSKLGTTKISASLFMPDIGISCRSFYCNSLTYVIVDHKIDFM